MMMTTRVPFATLLLLAGLASVSIGARDVAFAQDAPAPAEAPAAEEAPAEEAPAEEAPAEEPPAEAAPAAEEAAAGEAPAAEAPAANAPAAEAPAADAPAEEAPAEPAPPSPLANPDIDPAELSVRLIPLTTDELAALAEEWLAIVKAGTEAVAEEQVAILQMEPESDGAAAARERLEELATARRALFDRYTAVVDALELKGGDPAVIAGYRAYRSAIIVEETRLTDWRTQVKRVLGWVTNPDGGIALARQVGIVVASFLGLVILAGLVRRIARRALARVPNLSKLLQAFLVVVIYWLTIAVGLMIVLAGLGVNVTPLFALVGGASFIIAFAMQDTLGNLAAGLMIMINRPFDEGDSVDIGGVSGTVKAVSVVSTTVLTPDNEVIVVPNSKVWGNVIRNSSASETRRVDLVFGIARSESIDKAQKVLEETVRSNARVLDEPAPSVSIAELTDSAVRFSVQPWVRREDHGAVQADLIRKVKENLEAAGIAVA
jgi:small conductance mechanosensitive channel